MKNLEYIQIKGDIDREKSGDQMGTFRYGMIMIAAGLIVHLSMGFPGFLSGLFFLVGIISIIASCFTRKHLQEKYEKLNELYQKNVSAEDAIAAISKIKEALIVIES